LSYQSFYVKTQQASVLFVNVQNNDSAVKSI